MKTKRLTLITLWIFFAIVARADAWAAPTAAGDIPLAEAYWGGPPTQCSVVEFTATIVPGDVGYATQPQPGWYGPCVIHMPEPETWDQGYWWTQEYVCLVAIHEEGHLHGLGHSTDPSSIMYGSFPLTNVQVPNRCKEHPEPPVDASHIPLLPQHNKRFVHGAAL